MASFDKILCNNIKLIKIFKLFRGLKTPKKTCMVGKKVDLVRKKYDVLLNTGLI